MTLFERDVRKALRALERQCPSHGMPASLVRHTHGVLLRNALRRLSPGDPQIAVLLEAAHRKGLVEAA